MMLKMSNLFKLKKLFFKLHTSLSLHLFKVYWLLAAVNNWYATSDLKPDTAHCLVLSKPIFLKPFQNVIRTYYKFGLEITCSLSSSQNYSYITS